MVTNVQIRRLTRALVVVQGAAVVATLWAVFSFVATDAPAALPKVVQVSEESAADGSMSALRPLNSYAPLWTRDLRQPPIPPQAQQKQTAPPDNQPVPQLLGTFVESSGAFAHFRTLSGATRVCGAGDRVDDYEVVSIETGRALLRRSQVEFWIEIPKLADNKVRGR